MLKSTSNNKLDKFQPGTVQVLLRSVDQGVAMYTLDFEQILKWITYSQYLYLSYKPSLYSDDRSILYFNVPADKENFSCPGACAAKEH